MKICVTRFIPRSYPSILDYWVPPYIHERLFASYINVDYKENQKKTKQDQQLNGCPSSSKPLPVLNPCLVAWKPVGSSQWLARVCAPCCRISLKTVVKTEAEEKDQEGRWKLMFITCQTLTSAGQHIGHFYPLLYCRYDVIRECLACKIKYRTVVEF